MLLLKDKTFIAMQLPMAERLHNRWNSQSLSVSSTN